MFYSSLFTTYMMANVIICNDGAQFSYEGKNYSPDMLCEGHGGAVRYNDVKTNKSIQKKNKKNSFFSIWAVPYAIKSAILLEYDFSNDKYTVTSAEQHTKYNVLGISSYRRFGYFDIGYSTNTSVYISDREYTKNVQGLVFSSGLSLPFVYDGKHFLQAFGGSYYEQNLSSPIIDSAGFSWGLRAKIDYILIESNFKKPKRSFHNPEIPVSLPGSSEEFDFSIKVGIAF